MFTVLLVELWKVNYSQRQRLTIKNKTKNEERGAVSVQTKRRVESHHQMFPSWNSNMPLHIHIGLPGQLQAVQ